VLVQFVVAGVSLIRSLNADGAPKLTNNLAT
jgi:hypothetical protein